MLLDAMQYSSCTQSPLLEMWKCVEDTASLAVKSGDMGLLFEHVLCFLSGLITTFELDSIEVRFTGYDR